MTIQNPVPNFGTPASGSVSSTPSATPAARPAAAKPTARAAAPKKAAKPAKKEKPKDLDGTYKVLTGIDDATFCARVCEHLDKGWELRGDVAATFNGKNVILAQALVRKKKPAKRKKK